MTMPDLFRAAETAGHLSPEDRIRVATALAQAPEKRATPWYVQALVTTGAWFAAMLLLAFCGSIFGALIWDKPTIGFPVGFTLICAAMVLQRWQGGTFFNQAALALSVAGHVLALYGAGRLRDSFGVVVLSAFLLAALFYVPNRDPLHRLLATLSALALSTIWIDLKLTGSFFSNSGPSPGEVHIGRFALYTSAAVHCVLLGAFIVPPQSRPALRPLCCALVISLVGLLLPLAIPFTTRIWVQQWPLSFILGTSLLAALAWAAGGIGRLRTHPAIYGSIFVAALLLGFGTSPSILAALALLVAGFGLQDRILFFLGALSLPVFISTYYYSLQMDLRSKSLLLLASGAVLLILRAVLIRLPWAQNEEPTA